MIATLPKVLIEQRRQLDPLTLAAAAVLWAGRGAVVTMQTAAFLHGLTAADPTPIHLLLPYDRSPRKREGITLHSGCARPGEIVNLHGLPVLGLEPVLVELLCTGPRRTALACTDQALHALPLNQRPALHDVLTRRLYERADRRGTNQAYTLLELATGLPESPPESWMMLVLVDAGFPPPRSQYSVCNLDGRALYRLDHAWEEVRVAVEYDGYAAHAERVAEDAARDDDLRRRGWAVVHADARDLADPTRLISRLRTAFNRSSRTR